MITKPLRPLALVTGASGGIGADLARELSNDGHDLVLVARRVSAMEKLANELRSSGAEVHVIASDLGVSGAAASLHAAVGALRREPLGVLVNNAGLGTIGAFVESKSETLAEIIAVNVTALTELTRLFLPEMIAARRGRILFVASMAGHLPGPFAAAYHASKAYVLSLGEALAYELRGTGVTATTLCPGPTRTGYARAAGAESAAIFEGSLLTPVMESTAVARIGYRALKSGRPVVVAGIRNRLSVLSMSFMPRPLLLPLSARLNRIPTRSRAIIDARSHRRTS